MSDKVRQADPTRHAPRVSVIIPAYNSAATLARAIESVMAQSCDDWELIVVDDGSTDDTTEIAAAYEEKLGERMQYVCTANRGPGAARNTGIGLARGTYVAFLDADDELLPQKFARQIALFDRSPDLGLVFSDYSYIDVNGEQHASVFDDLISFVWDIPFEEVDDRLRVCGLELLDRMSGRYIVSTITGMVRRDVLGDDVRFPVGLRYCEEWLFFLEVCRRARGGYVAEALSLHHHTQGSVSRSSVQRNLEHRIQALQHVRRTARGASSRARKELRDQLSASHRQLACDHYKSGAFTAACRHFAGALRNEPDLRTGFWFAQAALRSLIGSSHA